MTDVSISISDLTAAGYQVSTLAAMHVSPGVSANLGDGSVASTRKVLVEVKGQPTVLSLAPGGYLFEFFSQGLPPLVGFDIPEQDDPISLADLFASHQVDPSTWEPLPSAPTVGDAIAAVQSSADAAQAAADTASTTASSAQATAESASTAAAAAQETASAALPASGLDAATAPLVPDVGTATGAALSAAFVAAQVGADGSIVLTLNGEAL